jgi:predicted TIM-barrel fold metal-dependent hydrolase
MLSKVGIKVIDAHAHFITYESVKAWLKRGITVKQMRRRVRFQTDMINSFKLPEEAWDTGQLWADELDKYGITASGMMIGAQVWDEFLDARRRFPGYFLGYAMVRPGEEGAVDTVKRAGKDGFQGIKLYPSSMDFPIYDEQVYPIYKEALKQKLLVILHFGVTIGSRANLRFGNPIDIQRPAQDFPDLNFMIAHFGAGYFRESLMLMYQTPNVLLDTSGSNIWMKYHPHDLTLKKIFRSALNAGDSCRIVFGTDSSFFPRGFRYNILKEQYKVVKELAPKLNYTNEDVNLVFYENILRLTGFKPRKIELKK